MVGNIVVVIALAVEGVDDGAHGMYDIVVDPFHLAVLVKDIPKEQLLEFKGYFHISENQYAIMYHKCIVYLRR